MKYQFNIEPVQQQRPRATRMGAGIRLYDPKKTKDFKNEVKRIAKSFKATPIDDPCKIIVTFYRSNQKNVSKREIERREIGKSLPSKKPDLDNYLKSFLDALTGVMWTDDNLICEISAKKRYSINPRIELEIINLKELEHTKGLVGYGY